MKYSNFYKLIIETPFFTKESLTLSVQEVHLLEVINKLGILGDYLRYSYYIPLDSGYNIRDVIRSPMPLSKKKRK